MRSVRAVVVFIIAGFLLVICAAATSAHVTVHPTTAVAGSTSELTFRAPNEQATARFTKLIIHLPAAQPLASLYTRPVPGWAATVTTAPLAKPITTMNGTTTKYTATVTWTATNGGVPPGEYQDFDISTGPLPDKGTMVFTADQTYDNAVTVHWSQLAKAGAAEPDHPAPVLTLTSASTSSSSTDGVARGLGIAGLIVGVLGIALAGLAYRRRTHQP